jgi:hypothetical protein
MNPSRELAARFEAYGDWRRRLSAGIGELHEWLGEQDLVDPQVDLKVQQLLERRRILARQIRAHQRDLFRGLRPAAFAIGGRTDDDVPDRAPA